MFGLEQLFSKSKFSQEDENDIRTILESPESVRILERAEQERVQSRMALRSRLDDIDARHDRNIANASATLQAATRAVQAAESNLLAVREQERQARTALYAAELIKGNEARELRQELIDMRDTRGDEFHGHLQHAWDTARHLVDDNLDDVIALRGLLQSAMSAIETMALLPLTRAEVSERLTALSHSLEPKLRAFALPCPMLDERGAVLLNRERLPFVEVLRDNGLFERGDVPKPQAAVPAYTTKPAPAKRPVVPQKAPSVAVKRPGALKPAVIKRAVRLADGSLWLDETYAPGTFPMRRITPLE